jgi:hypothetical protein
MSGVARTAEERAVEVEAAARLLARAMRDSHGPVNVLAGALERMALALAQCARARERERTDGGDPALRDQSAALEALERDIGLCIESLQFHDRLIQRLERVRGCLTGAAAEQRASESTSSAGSPEGSIELFE